MLASKSSIIFDTSFLPRNKVEWLQNHLLQYVLKILYAADMSFSISVKYRKILSPLLKPYVCHCRI